MRGRTSLQYAWVATQTCPCLEAAEKIQQSPGQKDLLFKLVVHNGIRAKDGSFEVKVHDRFRNSCTLGIIMLDAAVRNGSSFRDQRFWTPRNVQIVLKHEGCRIGLYRVLEARKFRDKMLRVQEYPGLTAPKLPWPARISDVDLARTFPPRSTVHL